MKEDPVVRLSRPGASLEEGPLLAGARRMLTAVIEAEVEAFAAAHAELVDAQGRRRVVRNGHAPERSIQTGVDPVPIRLRTDKSRSCLSRKIVLATVFKLGQPVERHWHRLDGSGRLGRLIAGLRFRNGAPIQPAEESAAA